MASASTPKSSQEGKLPSPKEPSSPKKLAGSRIKTYTIIPDNPYSYNKEGPDDFPMFIAMTDCCITSTGFADSPEKDEIIRKVKLMNGEVNQAYTSRTTHILAAHANTSKVEIGRHRGVPIVTVEWVEQLWEDCNNLQNPYLHVSLPKYRDFACPLFYNLHFYFSKLLDSETNKFYKGIVENNGGTMVTHFKKLLTSFYICEKPENEGIYRYALGMRVPCITVAWISDSVAKKKMAAVDEFEVRLRPSKSAERERDYEANEIPSSWEWRGSAASRRSTPNESQSDTESRKRNRMSTWEGDRADLLPRRSNGGNSGNDTDSGINTSGDTLNATCRYGTFPDLPADFEDDNPFDVTVKEEDEDGEEEGEQDLIDFSTEIGKAGSITSVAG